MHVNMEPKNEHSHVLPHYEMYVPMCSHGTMVGNACSQRVAIRGAQNSLGVGLGTWGMVVRI